MRLRRALIEDRRLHGAILVALSFILYSNNFQHEYHLDDGYTIVGNRSLRSLAEIPRFFVDPSTYTSNRDQVDYRPVLQVSYAINYWMGAYDSWWWHLTQIVLHALVALGVYALCRRVLVLAGHGSSDWIALLAGVFFVVHPTASGVVNYLNARSSLLTAVFLLPALLAYMKPIEGPGYARPAWAATGFYAFALFTKSEAIGALGAFWAYELWQRGRESPRSGLVSAVRQSLDARTWRRMAPALALTLLYLGIRRVLLAGYPISSGSWGATGVSPYEYFLTQLTAWWYYVARWIAPVRLIADYQAYPVFRSWSDPVVMLAASGWVMVSGLLAAAWRGAPYLLFLSVSALAILSPTSSFVPLAEMVNEHRPYLPIGILSLGLFVAAGAVARRRLRGAALVASVVGIAVGLLSLAALTHRRNEVFSTGVRYWQDVLAKAPSARAHVNYGRTFFAADDTEGALGHFRQALELAPYWYITHLNLAAAYQRLGDVERAREHHELGVRYDTHTGMALNRRGEFRLSEGDFAAARDDFLQSLPVSLERYRNLKGLATALAGLGDVAGCLEQTQRMLELEPQQARRDIPSVSLPFFRSSDLYARGIEYYEGLISRLSDAPWVQENIARLAALAGDPQRASEARERAEGTDPSETVTSASSVDPQVERMDAGLGLLYEKRDPVAAAEEFRALLAMNPLHYGAHYQLAVALDRAGEPGDARPLWERVLQMAEGFEDQATADTARRRLEQGP